MSSDQGRPDHPEWARLAGRLRPAVAAIVPVRALSAATPSTRGIHEDHHGHRPAGLRRGSERRAAGRRHRLPYPSAGHRSSAVAPHPSVYRGVKVPSTSRRCSGSSWRSTTTRSTTPSTDWHSRAAPVFSAMPGPAVGLFGDRHFSPRRVRRRPEAGRQVPRGRSACGDRPAVARNRADANPTGSTVHGQRARTTWPTTADNAGNSPGAPSSPQVWPRAPAPLWRPAATAPGLTSQPTTVPAKLDEAIKAAEAARPHTGKTVSATLTRGRSPSTSAARWSRPSVTPTTFPDR